jgi:hypothetical protein
MKVYIAAPYSLKDMIKAEAQELISLGIGVTCSWVNEPHKPTTQMADLTHEQHQEYAVQDVLDVAAADAIVFHTDPTGLLVRAGRHVEFGMAAAINQLVRPMPAVVIGMQYENIFHHLPQVTHVENWEAAKTLLMEMAEQFERTIR